MSRAHPSRSRRRGLAWILAAASWACSSGAPPSRSALAAPAGQLSSARLGVPAVRTLALTVSHLDRSLALFQALDFRVQSERYARGSAFSAWSGMAGAEMRAVRLALGAEEIELREFVAPPGRGIPPDTQSNDQIFQHMAIVVRDMDQAVVRLRSVPGVELVSAAPETIPFSNPAAGGIRALYFKDPDHHNLELIWFPEGKGRQRWHAQQTGLFLGIDHSAIAVSDSARSAPFYESLGFVAAGHSLNEGAEQARLSGVPDARVQITGFAAESGPGVEFLDYLAPGVGRSAPSNTSVNDLWHWEIYVEVADLASAMDAVTTHGGASRSALDVSALEPGYRLSSLVRDPDGHCLQLLQR